MQKSKRYSEMDHLPLDLNDPEDAREYVLAWVDNGNLKCEDAKLLIDGDDEDFIRVAKQLFLYVDAREALGEPH